MDMCVYAYVYVYVYVYVYGYVVHVYVYGMYVYAYVYVSVCMCVDLHSVYVCVLCISSASEYVYMCRESGHAWGGACLFVCVCRCVLVHEERDEMCGCVRVRDVDRVWCSAAELELVMCMFVSNVHLH